jgi:hypothetical protein
MLNKFAGDLDNLPIKTLEFPKNIIWYKIRYGKAKNWWRQIIFQFLYKIARFPKHRQLEVQGCKNLM